MEENARLLAETAIRMLGDRWKMQIIECLMDGTKRFGELKRELGNITQKVLTSNLRMLEENGILVRHIYAQIPPRVDYTLTSVGYNLRPVIDSMVAWAEEYRETIVLNLNEKIEQSKAKISESCAAIETSIEEKKIKLETSFEKSKNKIESKINHIKKNF